MKINVLGTEYTIEVLSEKEDTFLEKADGYCDKTGKRIVVKAEDEKSELECYDIYLKKVKRHEIIHAFLFESGLHENFRHNEWGHDETQIDWFAVQFPRLLETFKAADAL